MNQLMLEVSLASILGCVTAAVALFPNQRINVLLFLMHGKRRTYPEVWLLYLRIAEVQYLSKHR